MSKRKHIDVDKAKRKTSINKEKIDVIDSFSVKAFIIDIIIFILGVTFGYNMLSLKEVSSLHQWCDDHNGVYISADPSDPHSEADCKLPKNYDK